MKTQKVLKVLNPLLPILVLWQLFTSLFRSQIGYEAFERTHPIGGFLLVIVAAAHLILNWGWVKNAYFKK